MMLAYTDRMTYTDRICTWAQQLASPSEHNLFSGSFSSTQRPRASNRWRSEGGREINAGDRRRPIL